MGSSATGPRSALGVSGSPLRPSIVKSHRLQRETQSIVKRVALAGLVLATVLAITYQPPPEMHCGVCWPGLRWPWRSCRRNCRSYSRSFLGWAPGG